MKEYGLKLWSTNTDSYRSEAQRLYNVGIYDYIELYVVPNSFDAHINLWKQLEIPFIIHAPHFRNGLNLAKKDNFEQNLKMSEESQKFANELNAEYIIFHPGIAGDAKETVRQLNIINDSRILIENKPYYTVLGDGNICNGNSPEEIEYILENTKSVFCLDIGHCFCAANAKNIKPYEYLKQFLKFNPQMYHLTDNDFLRSLGEVGMLGTAVFILIFIEIIKKIVRLLRENDKFLRYFSIGTLSLILAFVINGLFIDVFEASKVASLFWMIVGLNLSVRNFK